MIIGAAHVKTCYINRVLSFYRAYQVVNLSKRLYDQLSVQNVYNHCKHTYFRLHKYSGIFIFRQLIFGQKGSCLRPTTSLYIFGQLIFGQSTSVRKLILSENKCIYSIIFLEMITSSGAEKNKLG